MSTAVPQSINAQMLATLPAATRINLTALAERLDAYIQAMKPGRPVDPRQGASLQQALWNAIKHVLARPPHEFNLMYSELLFVINQHRAGVFSERYVYRFLNEVKLSARELRNFERVMNLLMSTCNPATRHLAVQQIDMRSVMRDMNDESVVEKLLSYYTQ